MFVFFLLFKTIGVAYARAFSFLGLVYYYRISLLETDFNILTYSGLSKTFCVCQQSYFECCIVLGQKMFCFPCLTRKHLLFIIK